MEPSTRTARVARNVVLRTRLAAGTAVILSLSAGCMSLPGIPHTITGVPPHHIVMIDTHGNLVDPTADSSCYEGADWSEEANRQLKEVGYPNSVDLTSRPCLGRFVGLGNRRVESADRYLADVIREMEAHFLRREASARPIDGRPPKREIALIVHGGYNTNRENIEAARDIAIKMLSDPEAPYPILVNWQSNLWGSLWDHYFRIRQGEAKSPAHAFVAIPYLAADLGRGVGRALATGFYHYDNEFKRNRARYSPHRSRTDEIYCELRSEWSNCVADGGEACSSIALSVGPMRHLHSEGFKKAARSFWTNYPPVRVYAQLLGTVPSGAIWTYLPVKLLTAPLLDGLGRPAWETMIRHVKVGFHQDGGPRPEEDFAAGPEGSIYEAEQGYGGVARFLRLLTAHIDATDCDSEGAEAAICADWEVTLIGHSMGTIMANQMLAEFGDDLDVEKIVYMAAACSVGEYESTVLGYMKRHPATEMYHVTLHPFAEIRDQYAMELPPSGSLLVWVDNFLSNPSTPRDRTAGRSANLMLALPATPASLRSRIHVKAFGVGAALSSTDPQGHGDFFLFAGPLTEYEKNSGAVSKRDPAIRFWRPEFWEPEIENRSTLKQRCGDEPMMERR